MKDSIFHFDNFAYLFSWRVEFQFSHLTITVLKYKRKIFILSLYFSSIFFHFKFRWTKIKNIGTKINILKILNKKIEIDGRNIFKPKIYLSKKLTIY